MKKSIDLNKTVYELNQLNPDILEIMKEIGFEDVIKPGMVNTVGKFMTLVKGTKMKGININRIKEAFVEKGYEIIE